MKNLNRLTALTLTAALTAALTACGGTAAASSGTTASADPLIYMLMVSFA